MILLNVPDPTFKFPEQVRFENVPEPPFSAPGQVIVPGQLMLLNDPVAPDTTPDAVIAVVFIVVPDMTPVAVIAPTVKLLNDP